MAEARSVEGAEGCGDVRDVRIRNQRAADPPESPKSDYLPLRRPQITVISAEPLASDIWFSGTTVVFPPSPPPVWSADIDPVPQPPPSYDQVVQEKTWEEHGERPIAAPRRTSGTTTSATQTDLVKGDTPSSAPEGSTAPKDRSAGKKPQKPPRPLLPKSAVRKPSSESAPPTDEKLETNLPSSAGSSKEPSDSRLDINQQCPSDSAACRRSVTVHWDAVKDPLSTPATEASSSHPQHSQKPVPLPRSKQRKQPLAEEHGGQILVQLGEGYDTVGSDPGESASNKYLNELLEVFGPSNEQEENIISANGLTEGEDADGEMSNIRDRIQAFESQGGPAESSESAKPEPEPRKVLTRPPVAAKPSVTLKPQFNHSVDDDSQNVSNPPALAPKPQPPKKPLGLSIKGELEALHSKGAIPNRSHPAKLTRSSCVYDEDPSPIPPLPPVKPTKEPLKPNLNINNHNSTFVIQENQYGDSPSNNVPVNRSSFAKPSGTRRPTTIRVPSKPDTCNTQDNPPPLPAQKPVGELALPPRRLSKTKSLPPRPPPAKTGPGRPPPPSIQNSGRSQSASWDTPAKKQSHRRGPGLPPRPKPGHRLYNKYTLPLPHGIAAMDHGGAQAEELSFQKNQVLLLIEEIDHNTYECQVGDDRGRVHKSHMKIITPLSSVADLPPPQYSDSGLTVQALYDFSPEGPGELSLRAGDVLTTVEQVDPEWYRGTCRGSTGFFPVSYVKILSNSPRTLPARKTKPPAATASGPRCVARFDFEGEHSDELSFSEGDVIQLKAYVGQDWARGQMATSIGIFPLNFVEVIEDLPPPPSQQQPNKVLEATKPAEASQAGVEWVVALYDFAGKSEGDLSFQQGDHILFSRHIDSGWSCGQLNGREGIFPRAFVQSAGHQPPDDRLEAAISLRGRALYDFTSDSDEELSLQVGDIITNLESIDEEWFLGDLRGKRALVPKNYIQVL